MTTRLVQGISIVMVLSGLMPAQSASIFWVEHVDDWSDFNKWSPAVVPTSIDSVFIGDAFDNQNDHVDVDIAAAAGALTISEGGTTQIADVLDINDGRSLNIHGGGILNDGHIQVNGASSATTIRRVPAGWFATWSTASARYSS